MENISQKVIEFLKKYKDGNVPDEDVHALSKKLRIPTDELESKFYELASKYVNQPKSIEETDNEQLSGIDVITMDVPLFIRMLEYAKEDAKTDMDLHRVTENILELSKNNSKLSMSNYNTIVGEKQIEATEQTMASSSGSYEAPLFSKAIKRPIGKIPNYKQDVEENIESSGGYDVPLFGGKGRGKNPLKIDGIDSVKHSDAVTGKLPMLVKGSTYVKINDKCKKYPYCN
jgi:hypothetical protein